MSTKENNELRCIAAEVIVRLYHAKEIRQLELLEIQVRRSLEELRPKESVKQEDGK